MDVNFKLMLRDILTQAHTIFKSISRAIELLIGKKYTQNFM